jgi:hypothetical protein
MTVLIAMTAFFTTAAGVFAVKKSGILRTTLSDEYYVYLDCFKLPIFIYLLGIFVISFVIVFVNGPIKNPRIIIILKFFLKLVSFFFIIKGTSDLNALFSVIIIFFIFYLFFNLINCDILKNINKRIWPCVFIRKLLTMKEYANQADLFTKSKLAKSKE